MIPLGIPLIPLVYAWLYVFVAVTRGREVTNPEHKTGNIGAKKPLFLVDVFHVISH